MSSDAIEEMVEEIMRQYHMGSYEDYNSKELREKYYRMLEEANRDASSEDVQ